MYPPTFSPYNVLVLVPAELTPGTNYSAQQTSNSGLKKVRITIRKAHRMFRRGEPSSSKYWFARFAPQVREQPGIQSKSW